MACYVYASNGGALSLWGPSDDINTVFKGDLAANGLAVVTGLPSLDSGHAWNANAKTVVTAIPIQRSGGTPILTDYPANIAATGYALQVPTDGLTYNIVLWAQPNLGAFQAFCLAHGGWDKSLHSQLWIYLQSKVTSNG